MPKNQNKVHFPMKRYTPLLLSAAFLILIGGCSLVQQLSGSVQTPEVTYTSMKFNSLSFDGVTLDFDFEVDNPNRLDLRALGYTYGFSVEGNEFLSGSSDRGIDLAARSASTVTVPISLNFRELYNSVSAIATQDSIAYGVASTFAFDIPVLGRREVPVSAAGYLPIPRLPRLSLENISVGSLSLSGAEVLVSLKFNNPNNFSMSLSDVDYTLNVDGSRWISSVIREQIQVDARSEQIVTVPVRLDLGQLGMSVYRMLTGSQAFNYEVTGNGTVDLDLPFFESSRLPFNLSGSYRL
ncbi:MAG: LEA type 2 family protein [Bacteroidetes bacterium]|nr:LEA type 2 family protein [Bacteroidota bacterium]